MSNGEKFLQRHPSRPEFIFSLAEMAPHQFMELPAIPAPDTNKIEHIGMTRIIFTTLGILSCMAYSIDTNATCTYYTNAPNITIQMSGTYLDTPSIGIGGTIATFEKDPGKSLVATGCTGYSSGGAVVYTTPHGIDTNRVFPTNLKGVGVKIQGSPNLFVPLVVTELHAPGAYTGVYTQGTRRFIFVKTGPISPGTISSGDVPITAMILDGRMYQFMYPAGSMTITSPSCSISNDSVDMGTVKDSDFKGIGSTAGVVRVSMRVRGCSPGVSRVKYQLSAPGGMIDYRKGVLRLSADSSAKGVGIQLKSASTGAPIMFAFPISVSVNGGTGSFDAIASYYQYETTVQPGTAKSKLIFSVDLD